MLLTTGASKASAGSAWGWGPTRFRGGGAPRNKLIHADRIVLNSFLFDNRLTMHRLHRTALTLLVVAVPALGLIAQAPQPQNPPPAPTAPAAQPPAQGAPPADPAGRGRAGG